jgi:hypothetical protein
MIISQCATTSFVKAIQHSTTVSATGELDRSPSKMGMKDMIKGCVDSMMGSKLGAVSEKHQQWLYEMIESSPVGKLTRHTD